ncbi:MAG: site-specific DNA-methyltransferase [Pyrinomonadaceae bacterium]
MENLRAAYRTKFGVCYRGKIEEVLKTNSFHKYIGKFNLIFTSPPFPLNRKKKYGNLNGSAYVDWLSGITTNLKNYLAPNGSLVIEIGNSWEESSPLMSTLPLETLLAIKRKGEYKLCQQFVWFNMAKLPSPVQWVNIKRTRVKDSFTHIWWMSQSAEPKANNENVLEDYSLSMKKLLKSGKYNFGLRPSEHRIGERSFLSDNGGAIPSNVIVASNTVSNSRYLQHCKKNGRTPHPARMPPALAQFFIKFLTEEGDLILDPFAGSNTTGEVSELLKRKWISVEANRDYNDDSRFKFNDVP